MQKVLTLLGFSFGRFAARRSFQPSPRTAMARRSARSKTSAASSPWHLRLAYGLLALNIALAIFSIISVNSVAGGYILRELQANVEKLTELNKKLMVKSTELGSVVQLQEDLSASGYVAAGTPQFVQSTQLTQR
jgi:hypothetical protein